MGEGEIVCGHLETMWNKKKDGESCTFTDSDLPCSILQDYTEESEAVFSMMSILCLKERVRGRQTHISNRGEGGSGPFP